MTTPATGFPDFQSLPQWRSGNLLNSTLQTYAVGVTTSATFSMFNFASVGLLMAPGNGGVQVQLNWYDTPAHTNTLATDVWPCFTLTQLTAIVPVRGPYVTVTVNNTGGSPVSITQFFWGLNVAVPRVQYPAGPDPINLLSQSVPASGLLTFYRGYIHGGRLNLYGEPIDTTGKLTFFVQTQTEQQVTVGRLYRNTGPTAPFNADLPCPGGIVILQVQNIDAVSAHSFHATLWSADT